METSAFEIHGFVEQRKELESLMMSNPAMERKVQDIIRKVLMAVRRNMTATARDAMDNDPRQAYKAVKTAVYRQILGGSVSILNKRRRGAAVEYVPPRMLREGQRGGNRVPRGERTKQMDSYAGGDRGFILRFLNAGTNRREAGTRGGRLSGNRGSIGPRSWFGNRSETEMRRAASNLAQYIDALIIEYTL